MPTKEITIATQVIAEQLQLPVDKWLKTRNRQYLCVYARYILAKYLRNKGYSYPQIGAIIGFDHCTALYLVNKYQVPLQFISYEKKIMEEIQKAIENEDNYYMQIARDFVEEIFQKGFVDYDEFVMKIYHLILRLKK